MCTCVCTPLILSSLLHLHLFFLFPSRLQGDGISYESLGSILENMKTHKWSADNLAFGSGGALLQRINRDTQKCAFKCSYAVINGKGVCLLFHSILVKHLLSHSLYL